MFIDWEEQKWIHSTQQQFIALDIFPCNPYKLCILKQTKLEQILSWVA